MRAATLFAAALAASACTAEPPEVEDPGTGLPETSRFGDTVMSHGASSSPMTCADVLPSCEQGVSPTCGPTDVLGEPDGQTHSLGLGETIVIALRCGSVRENGGVDTPDLAIWTDAPPGTRAIVEVSRDGTEFIVLGDFGSSNPEFDMSRIELEVAQQVQISVTQGGPLALDAIEALTAQ